MFVLGMDLVRLFIDGDSCRSQWSNRIVRVAASYNGLHVIRFRSKS